MPELEVQQPGFEITDEQLAFIPSNKEVKVITDIFRKFRNSATQRNQNFSYFDDLNIIDYIDDSVRRFNTNIDERDSLEDWQARIHTHMTRNKVNTILGRVGSVLPIASFRGRGEEDIRKGIILTNLYEYAEDIDDYEELMTQILLEAIVKGTAIGFEGVEKHTRLLREVKGVGDNSKVRKVKETTTRLFGSLVPLEEFYPSNVGIRTIKRMPYCFRRKIISLSDFLQQFSAFSKHTLVQPKRTHTGDEERPYYLDFISHDVVEGNVELIWYYDKDNDQYIILANGLWLNPIKGKGSSEIIAPLPYKHKELPFWEIKFDHFGDFFYGKSLPDKLKTMQDVLNVLTNMLLDQSFLTIFPPMLTNGYDSIEDDYLRPGRRTPIDTQGLPINDAFLKLDLGTPSGWHQFILNYTKDMMEEASVDQITSGQAGVGGRTTASEVRVAAEGVAANLSTFARQVNYGIKRKAQLKAANILQYWTDKNSPMIRKVGGEDGNKEFNAVFNTFTLDGAVLTGGKRGTKIIELYSKKADLPSKGSLKARSLLQKTDGGKPVEIVALPGEYIRDFIFDVELVSNPKSDTSRDLDKALQLEKVRVYMSFFPEIVNVQELAAETAEKMGDDPTKILKDEVFNPQPQDGNSEIDSGVSTNPTENNANNLARSARGGEQGGAELAQLASQMKG